MALNGAFARSSMSANEIDEQWATARRFYLGVDLPPPQKQIFAFARRRAQPSVLKNPPILDGL